MGTREFWEGEFGDQYTVRHAEEEMMTKRGEFWGGVYGMTRPERVLEVGCNSGWNLRALRQQAIGKIDVRGVEINASAIEQARRCGELVARMPADEVGQRFPQAFDLAFTAGVLIHIPPEDLMKTMKSIVDASRRWVLAVEYEADTETEVEYRGHAGKLWKRPFGKLYEQFGLRCWWSVKLDKDQGFDNCTAWLLEKLA